jgi:hypothetical protein
VTTEPTRSINQGSVRHFLREAAAGCGGTLNSCFVVLGDKCGLYATGQYKSDGEEPVVRSQAPSNAQKRNSSRAADSPAHAHGRAIPSNDRAMSIQGDETAFMTLICHQCAPAADSHKVSP